MIEYELELEASKGITITIVPINAFTQSILLRKECIEYNFKELIITHIKRL